MDTSISVLAPPAFEPACGICGGQVVGESEKHVNDDEPVHDDCYDITLGETVEAEE